MNAYTISSGIFPKYLNGENIISVPLAENETMHIGYVLNENRELNELGKKLSGRIMEICSSQSIVVCYG
ncbi:MAG: hypothetical protein ACLTER_13585 [Ruminococcus sp.]